MRKRIVGHRQNDKKPLMSRQIIKDIFGNRSIFTGWTSNALTTKNRATIPNAADAGCRCAVSIREHILTKEHILIRVTQSYPFSNRRRDARASKV
jgi:cell division inhibitor SulA